MIKNIFNSKLTSSISADFAVIGLKITDTESFHKLGIILAIASFTLLFVGMVAHMKGATTPKASAKRSRRNRRSHTSRAN